jgi:hypothetical protein
VLMMIFILFMLMAMIFIPRNARESQMRMRRGAAIYYSQTCCLFVEACFPLYPSFTMLINHSAPMLRFKHTLGTDGEWLLYRMTHVPKYKARVLSIYYALSLISTSIPNDEASRKPRTRRNCPIKSTAEECIGRQYVSGSYPFSQISRVSQSARKREAAV